MMRGHHSEGATLSEGRQNAARRVPSPTRWTSSWVRAYAPWY